MRKQVEFLQHVEALLRTTFKYVSGVIITFND